MIFKNSISIIYRVSSTFWLQWIILIVDDARDICSVADYSWYTSAMFLICSWCAPDMLLVRSDILAALQGPARRSGNLHAIAQLYALDSIPFLNLIVALTSNGTRLGERKTPWSSQLLLTTVAASLLLLPQAKFGIPVLPLVAAYYSSSEERPQ